MSATGISPMPPTRLEYFDDMWRLSSTATVVAVLEEDSGRRAVLVDATIFHPQGGGQPADTGLITVGVSADEVSFVVTDVRMKNEVVYHYGNFEKLEDENNFKVGQVVNLLVDAEKRHLNSRLHSAGHLLDICMRSAGLSHLEPGKGYHFPDGPFVEYKGVIPKDQLESKQSELEILAETLISAGGKVIASVLPYKDAATWCGGTVPAYISQDSSPRIVKFGDYPGCPCGGTHVVDIADIKTLKVTQIRVKKGVTKVSYTIRPM